MNKKDTNVFMLPAKTNVFSLYVVFDESFFPYKKNHNCNTTSPTSLHVINIFDS